MKCPILFSGKNKQTLHEVSKSDFWKKYFKMLFSKIFTQHANCKYIKHE